MKELICPVCNEELILNQNSYKCNHNHCFDVSKYGVVNLSLNNKSSKKRHGDDKMMVIARKEFLDSGYYEAIQKAVVSRQSGSRFSHPGPAATETRGRDEETRPAFPASP